MSQTMTSDEILSLRMAAVLPVPVFLVFAGVYHFAAPHFETERKRAYILSTLSSCTMSLISLPLFYSYTSHGLEATYGAGQHGWIGALTRFGVVFFGTYLFADLSIGYFKYRSQVGLLTGWIHHICYILLMVFCLNSRHSPIFITAGIMEVPTFDLAISNLFPKLRNDLRFLSSFFLVRIAFHFALIINCARPSSRAITDGSFVPITMLILAFVLHVSWFQAGVKGYLKRAKAKEEVENVYVKPPVQAIYIPSPGTPEDSPLVTPHTPSMQARDSYLSSIPLPKGLPSLPNLANIPQLPLGHIPTVSIPTFSDLTAAIQAREQINWGFKDAVRTRWEHQREKLNGFGRDRMAGMALNLGGLRRRSADAAEQREEREVIE